MPHLIKILTSNHEQQNLIRIMVCDTFFYRLRGLMFRKNISQDEGLLLVQGNDSRVDSSIHMLFVPFKLGVIWINSNFKVVDRIIAKPWGLAYFPTVPAKYTLEIHPDHLTEFEIGDEVKFIEI